MLAGPGINEGGSGQNPCGKDDSGCQGSGLRIRGCICPGLPDSILGACLKQIDTPGTETSVMEKK